MYLLILKISAYIIYNCFVSVILGVKFAIMINRKENMGQALNKMAETCV